MRDELNFYINGDWIKSDSNELIDVINPANEEIVGQVTAGTKDDINKGRFLKEKYNLLSLNEINLQKKPHQLGCFSCNRSVAADSGVSAGQCRYRRSSDNWLKADKVERDLGNSFSSNWCSGD